MRFKLIKKPIKTDQVILFCYPFSCAFWWNIYLTELISKRALKISLISNRFIAEIFSSKMSSNDLFFFSSYRGPRNSLKVIHKRLKTQINSQICRRNDRFGKLISAVIPNSPSVRHNNAKAIQYLFVSVQILPDPSLTLLTPTLTSSPVHYTPMLTFPFNVIRHCFTTCFIRRIFTWG